jgi:hypothetical protein
MKAQRTQIAQALVRIAPEITAKDRTECAKKLSISKITICYYLNGKVTNNDKALEVLEYLKKRVNQRQKEIHSICQK